MTLHAVAVERTEPRNRLSHRLACNTTFGGRKPPSITRAMRDGESAAITPLSPKACWLSFCGRNRDRFLAARTSPALCAMHRPDALAPAPAHSPNRQRSSVHASTRRWVCRPVSDSSPATGLWPVRCAEVRRRLVSTFVGLLTSAIFWLSSCALVLAGQLLNALSILSMTCALIAASGYTPAPARFGRVGRPPV